MIKFKDIPHPRDPLCFRLQIFNEKNKKIQDLNLLNYDLLNRNNYSDKDIENIRQTIEKDSNRVTF